MASSSLDIGQEGLDDSSVIAKVPGQPLKIDVIQFADETTTVVGIVFVQGEE